MTSKKAPSERIAYPEWTETNAKGGLDPLGMQNSSIRLYQLLLPGISNVTLRIRYYGFYAWLADQYSKEIRSTDPEQWKRFIRRAGALYALVASRAGTESGVAGVTWAKRRLAEVSAQQIIDFDADTRPGSKTHYLDNAWGNFGAAYRGQLFEIGILDHADHDIPLPSRSAGEPLAKAFAESIGDSVGRFLNCVEAAKVSLEDLDAMACCLPSSIDPESRERVLYQRLLLGTSEFAGLGDAASRRLTIRLILRTTDLLGRRPDADDFRWALYSGRAPNGQPLNLQDSGENEQRDRWWVYQANDICQLACSTILKFALDTLEQSPGGVSFRRLVSDVVADIRDELPGAAKTWAAFLDYVPLASNSSDTEDQSSEAALVAATLEAGRGNAAFSSSAQAAKAVTLLAVLQKRVAERGVDLSETLGDLDPAGFRSVYSELAFLERTRDCNLRATLRQLVGERILQRHLWVALKKLRYQGDYTFLIESDGGQLRLRGKDGPSFTNPRLRPTIGFLEDLQMIDEQGLARFGREALSG